MFPDLLSFYGCRVLSTDSRAASVVVTRPNTQNNSPGPGKRNKGIKRERGGKKEKQKAQREREEKTGAKDAEEIKEKEENLVSLVTDLSGIPACATQICQR